MAEPTSKSASVEKVITAIIGTDRREVIKNDMCIPEPFGCGGSAATFRDTTSQLEYRISGMCQNCQDKLWGTANGR